MRTQIFFLKLSYFQVLMKSFSLSWTGRMKLQIGGWQIIVYIYIYIWTVFPWYMQILHEEHNLRPSKGFVGFFRTLQVASRGLFPRILRYMYSDCWFADLLRLDILNLESINQVLPIYWGFWWVLVFLTLEIDWDVWNAKDDSLLTKSWWKCPCHGFWQSIAVGWARRDRSESEV